MVTFFLSPDDQGSPVPQLCCNAAAAQQRATSVFPAPAWQGTSPLRRLGGLFSKPCFGNFLPVTHSKICAS